MYTPVAAVPSGHDRASAGTGIEEQSMPPSPTIAGFDPEDAPDDPCRAPELVPLDASEEGATCAEPEQADERSPARKA
jgi:hypothetical protein